MVSRRDVVSGSIVGGTLAISGCLDALPFGDPPVEDVEMSIDDARSPDFGLLSLTLPIMLEIQNTNSSERVPSPTIDYRAIVNDVEVASDRIQAPTLDPEGTVTEEIELVADYADLGSGALDAAETGDLRLTLNGEVRSEGASATISDTYKF